MLAKSLSTLGAVLFVSTTIVLAGCGGSGSVTVVMPSGTGGITAKLVWEQKSAAKSVADAPAGVVTVRLAVSGPGMATMQQDFPAASGSGTITGVPVGSGLTVKASGLDAAGILIYEGSTPPTVTVQDGQTTDVGTIAMKPLPSTLTSISVTPANPNIAVGSTQQFTATGTYGDNSTRDLTAVVSWSSSSTAVATISTSGIAFAGAAGSTTITATSGTVRGTAILTAQTRTPNLVSISVTPATINMAINASEQFMATGTYDDNSTKNLTASVIWSSSSISVATISSGGIATAVGPGSTTITATSGTVAGTAALAVQVPPQLMSINVTPTSPVIGVGATLQFIATGTYVDNSARDLTASVNWSASNVSNIQVATISSGGMATAVGQGAVTITARQGSISGATTLTVR